MKRLVVVLASTFVFVGLQATPSQAAVCALKRPALNVRGLELPSPALQGQPRKGDPQLPALRIFSNSRFGSVLSAAGSTCGLR